MQFCIFLKCFLFEFLKVLSIMFLWGMMITGVCFLRKHMPILNFSFLYCVHFKSRGAMEFAFDVPGGQAAHRLVANQDACPKV